MALGSVLLQPQRIQRAAGISADRALIDDLVSVALRLALDPAQGEAIVLAFETALQGMGDRLLANVSGDFQPVLDRLRDWLQPALAHVDTFVAALPQIDGLDQAVAALAQMAGALAQAAEGLTIQQLRQQITALIDILENDVGLTPAFLEQQVFAIFDDVIAELEQIPADIAAEARATRRAVTALLRRIKTMLTGKLTPQPLNADRIATTVLDTLRSYGWDQFAETGSCLATNLQDLLTAGSTLTGILSDTTFGNDSVGAAAAPSTSDQYRWYATWLLQTRTRPTYYSVWTWIPFFPPDEVWMTQDNSQLIQRNVHRADTLLHSGSGIQWKDAPLFNKDTSGEHYLVERIPHGFMEGWAYHTAWIVDFAKSIAHLVTIEGGNLASHLLHFFWNAFNMFWKLPTGAPFNSWCNAGFGGPQWTRWLLDFAWPTALTLLGSLESRHTAADEAKSAFWAILLADDVLEAVTIDAVANLIRDLFLSMFTLINYSGPAWDNPADDHRPLNKEHMDAWVTLAVFIANKIMIAQFPRDRYTYPGDDRRATVKPDQTRLLVGEWWFGWNTLSTLLGVITGWLVGCTWSRTFDLNVLWKQAVKQLLTNWVTFLLTLYGRENNTDDGKYNPRGAAFSGYPGHDNSPYKLPYASGQAEACVQGNQGLWSHNDFAGTSQVYSYDFALDQGKEILAARSGTVVDYFDWVPNDQHPSSNVSPPPAEAGLLTPGQTTSETWNFVLIRHDNPFSGSDPAFTESAEQRNAHDKGPGGTVIQTYGVYGHGRTGSVREMLEPCRVAQGLPSLIGLKIKQGTPIMRSGNTGHSFVNHVHMHIQAEPPPAGSTTPATSATVPFTLGSLDDYTIPFVFQEVGGDGVPKSLSFNTSSNTRQECS
jgi:hypothetical protein